MVNNMEHWEKLIWDWPTATRRYDVADWQLMMEGVNQCPGYGGCLCSDIARVGTDHRHGHAHQR